MRSRPRVPHRRVVGLPHERGERQVAAVLGVTRRTAAFHKYALMRRLKVRTTAELVQRAVKLGLIRP